MYAPKLDNVKSTQEIGVTDSTHSAGGITDKDLTIEATDGETNGISKAKTGIKVIVVGAGFGGLSAAIESHLQGHDVDVYKSFTELKVLGDIITFEPNSGRLFRRWRYKTMIE